MSTTTTTVPDVVCYEVDRRKSLQRISGVSLDDEFGPGTVTVSKSKRFCNPANKNGGTPAAPADPQHLTGYIIKQRTPPFARVTGQTVSNQFGTFAVDVLRPIKILVPTAKSLTGPPAPLINPTIDHYKCYQVKRSVGTSLFAPIRGVTVQDQFGTLIVDVRRVNSLCAPANKNGEGIPDPATHLMCFMVRLASSSPVFKNPAQFFINNQFGPDTLEVSHADELCVPSLKTP